jgi:glycosyltransferase involved in cell wall biosynthesis
VQQLGLNSFFNGNTDNQGKILYIMHIPWGWIKQRPHFLAEELAEYYDITIVSQKSYRRNKLTKNKLPFNIKFKEIFRLPFNDKSKLISIVNDMFFSFKIKKFLRKSNYEYVWFTSPTVFYKVRFIDFKNYKIIYDCMDDILEFPSIKKNNRIYKDTLLAEKKLCEKSDIIFCVSNVLKNRILNRYKIQENKIKIINNAIDCSKKWNISKNNNSGDILKFCYIGTIDEWFDFGLIMELIEKFYNKIEVYLCGPSFIEIPESPKLHYVGILEHDELPEFISKMDVLFMPFLINKLIEAIDPIKIYEYIASGKFILAPYFDSMDKFKDYVFLYSDKEEFFLFTQKIISNIINKPTINLDHFIKNNSWKARAKEIFKILKDN